MNAPLAIDLFAGLGGWTESLLAEGYFVVGFDVERHQYGDHRYPAQLVLQDVRTLHGSQFRAAALIVASPPCQEYSYMAMPWLRAKQIAREYENGERDRTKLTELFDACFRIQREACEAAGRHIPLIVENVRGAQKWVGRSRWNFGSFHLWGDVPALMPMASARKAINKYSGNGSWVSATGVDWRDPSNVGMVRVCDCGHTENNHDYGSDAPCSRCSCVRPVYRQGFTKNSGGSWFAVANNTTSGKGNNPDGRKCPGGGAEGWFGANDLHQRGHNSKSPARKAASAMIAKIPPTLARHIARTFLPQENA